MKKNKILMVMAFLGMLLSSCMNTSKDESINTISDKTEKQKEDSKNLVANLPLLIENTDYIVFPVRNNQIEELKRSSYDSRSWYNNYLDNLIFQNIKTGKKHVLTKERIKIISYERIKDSVNPDLNTTLYTVIDSFTKNDKVEAFTALYLSTNDGKNFTKITKSNEHLNSWNYIPKTNNIYFITNDDIDKNRRLDDKDGQSIHSVNVKDFTREDLLVEELKGLTL